MTTAHSVVPAGLMRRFAALLYDSLLLAGVWFFATFIALIVRHGAAIAPASLWYDAYLLAVGGLFFGGFWTHGGQTLGMRAWRIRVQRQDGAPLGWLLAWRRYLLAWVSLLLLGLGFFWLLVDKNRLTLHDRLSATAVIRTDR